MSLQEIVGAAIHRHRMLASGRRIGVAVSGGADSVFLLCVLVELGVAACVLHVNHKLRGEESDADEQFVAGLAAKFQLPFFVHCARVAEGNIEQEARRERYRFFAERIAAGVCDAVATGHTLDDQAETVLSRFLRGAGTAGLSGIAPVTAERAIRPVLGLRRSVIREWLMARQTMWREDSSNQSPDFLRNRLRNEILPKLAEINPSLPEVLASTADWASAEESWWEAELAGRASEIFGRKGEALLCRTSALIGQPIAMQRRLLRRAIRDVKGSLRSIDFRHVEAIRLLAGNREGSGRIQLPHLDIYRSFDWLRLAPIGYDGQLSRDFEAALAVPGKTRVPDRPLTIEMELVNGLTVYNDGMDVVDRGRSGDALIVRNWRPGDTYTPSGKAGPIKIKTLFQENRVPLWERRHWPVVASGERIVWSRGFGVDRDFAVKAGTREALRIREIYLDSEESNIPSQTSTEMSGSFATSGKTATGNQQVVRVADVSSGEAK